MPSQSSHNFIQWRAANAAGKYPFATYATLANDEVFIPDDAFVDAKLYPVGGDETLYLASVARSGNSAIFTVGTAANPALASGTYNSGSPVRVIKLSDGDGRSAGILLTTPEAMLPIIGWAEGSYTFTQDQTQFTASVIAPIGGDGVKSIRGGTNGTKYTDNVWLVGGRGVVLDATNPEEGDPVITVHAVGEPLYRRAVCEVAGFDKPCLLKTINELPADEFGNFQLGVCGVDANRSVFRIEPIDNGLTIKTIGRTL